MNTFTSLFALVGSFVLIALAIRPEVSRVRISAIQERQRLVARMRHRI